MINLGVGDPDRPTPEAIIKSLLKHVENPAFHQYALDQGAPELRKSIAAFCKRRYGIDLDPATAERSLDAIITKLKAAGVTVWLAGMLAPRNFGPEYTEQFDGLYKRLADKYNVPLYPFILDGVAQDAALNQPDGIHPNPKGVDIIIERLLPFVTKNLDDYAASVRRPARP